MKSFGIYYLNESALNDSISLSETHINVWKFTNKNGEKEYYMDFGISFNSSIKKILVYVPFELKDKSDIVDLGSIISNDVELLSKLFNADINSNNSSQSLISSISINENERFNICSLDINNQTNIDYIKINNTEKHSYFSLTIPQNEVTDSQKSTIKAKKHKNVDSIVNTTEKEKPEEKCYIRFRIKLHENNIISHKEYVANDVIQSAFSKLELFDFRLNDKRFIPSYSTQKLENGLNYKPFGFSKIHYFYMVDVSETLQTTSPACHDSRFYIADDWKSYLQVDGIKENNFISYHWKKEKIEKDQNIKSYKLCYSCLFPSRNIKQLLAYANLAVILGFLGSMLSFNFMNFVGGWSWNKCCVDLIKVIVVAVLIIVEIIYFKNHNNKKCD